MNFLLDYVSSIFLLKYSILYIKVMEVKHIVQGYINDVFNINENISKNRLKICYGCPLYSHRFGGVCNSRLWLNVQTGDVSITKKDGYKKGCGCKLSAKTRVPNAKCPLNKW